MKVILLENVKKVGEKGKLVEVSEGYARNFLFPKRLAVLASQGGVKELENKQTEKEKKQVREVHTLQKHAAQLSEKWFSVKMKAGEGGRIFGSVTPQNIADLIKKKTGIDFDKKWVHLEEPLRHLGRHTVKARYAADISGSINIEIIPEE